MSRDQEQRSVETPSLKPSPAAQSNGEEDAYDPSRDCKVSLGPITDDEDCERYARILQPAYERAHWQWRERDGRRNSIPSAEHICETIKILLRDLGPECEWSRAGGLMVKWEDDHPVLYAHTDLNPSQVALTG